ncbi:hypothetical protein ACJX0J_036486, partial [Zea mays]
VSCSSAEDHTCCGAFDPFRGTKDWRAHFRLHGLQIEHRSGPSMFPRDLLEL